MIGHDRVREELETNIPPVVLLEGVSGIGKSTLAAHLVAYYNVQPIDQRWFGFASSLSVNDARLIREWVNTRAYGVRKTTIIRMNNASLQAQNALLKVLEEPPYSTVFILLVSTDVSDVLPTIRSRANIYKLGLLSEVEIVRILTERDLSLSIDQTVRAARLSQGQVSRAIASIRKGDTNQTKASVLSLVKAIATKDSDLFEAATNGWSFEEGQEIDNSLNQWIREAYTEQWSVFTEDEMYGLHQDKRLLFEMMSALSKVNNARARIRVSLNKFAVKGSR